MSLRRGRRLSDRGDRGLSFPVTRDALREAWRGWAPPADAVRVLAIDAHTEGEPLRVILGGFPELSDATILARRSAAKADWDDLRKALMWEPRGHADMYGCLVTPPVSEHADIGVLFMHNQGFSTMCGHGIIGVTRVVLETGLVEMRNPVTPVGIDTPAGFVQAYARVEREASRAYFSRTSPRTWPTSMPLSMCPASDRSATISPSEAPFTPSSKRRISSWGSVPRTPRSSSPPEGRSRPPSSRIDHRAPGGSGALLPVWNDLHRSPGRLQPPQPERVHFRRR